MLFRLFDDGLENKRLKITKHRLLIEGQIISSIALTKLHIYIYIYIYLYKNLQQSNLRSNQTDTNILNLNYVYIDNDNECKYYNITRK